MAAFGVAALLVATAVLAVLFQDSEVLSGHEVAVSEVDGSRIEGAEAYIHLSKYLGPSENIAYVLKARLGSGHRTVRPRIAQLNGVYVVAEGFYPRVMNRGVDVVHLQPVPTTAQPLQQGHVDFGEGFSFHTGGQVSAREADFVITAGPSSDSIIVRAGPGRQVRAVPCDGVSGKFLDTFISFLNETAAPAAGWSQELTYRNGCGWLVRNGSASLSKVNLSYYMIHPTGRKTATFYYVHNPQSADCVPSQVSEDVLQWLRGTGK